MMNHNRCLEIYIAQIFCFLCLLPALAVNDATESNTASEKIHPFTLTTLYNFIKNGLTDGDRKTDAANPSDWLLMLLDDVNLRYLSDVQFTFGDDKKSYGHRLILSGRSPIFKRIFSEMGTSTGQIFIDDLQVDVFNTVLRFIYAKVMPGQADTKQIFGMLYAGQKYVVPSLVDASMDKIRKMLSAENAITVLEQSTRMDLKELIEKSWEVIRSQAKEVAQSPSFETATMHFLKAFMNQDRLTGLPESVLFERVLTWAKDKLIQVPEPGPGSAIPERSMDGAALNQRLRSVLQPVLHDFRFLSMGSDEFAKGPCMSGILTKDEQLEILLSIGNGDGGKNWKTSASFSKLQRSNA